MPHQPSPTMTLLEQTLDCLVAAVNVTETEVSFGFIRPEGGSICISIRLSKDETLIVSEVGNG